MDTQGPNNHEFFVEVSNASRHHWELTRMLMVGEVPFMSAGMIEKPEDRVRFLMDNNLKVCGGTDAVFVGDLHWKFKSQDSKLL